MNTQDYKFAAFKILIAVAIGYGGYLIGNMHNEYELRAIAPTGYHFVVSDSGNTALMVDAAGNAASNGAAPAMNAAEIVKSIFTTTTATSAPRAVPGLSATAMSGYSFKISNEGRLLTLISK